MIKIDSKKILKLLFSLLITVVFIYFFDAYIGFKKLFDVLKNITAEQIVLGFLLYVISYVVRTLRWKLTLDLKDFKKLFRLTVFNTFFNIILPFRVGELSFFYMLKKEGISLSHTTLSFVITRIFDGLSLVGVFGLFYFLRDGKFLYGLSIFFLSPFLFLPISTLIKMIKHRQIIDFHSKLQVINLVKIYTLSVLTLIFKFFAFYTVLPKTLGLPLSLSFLAFSTADLTTVLPVHGFAGIGTYESGFASILIALGGDKGVSFLSATVVHLFIIASSSMLAIITYIYFRKI